MASARLQITVESACNLYNADGILAGKSDPYVIVEVPGQEGMKMQTEVVSNNLNPVWNFTGELAGFMDGDILRFTVMDKDTFPKPDDFLGKVELTAQDFYPHGFHGELVLADSKTQATLSVMIVVIGIEEGPELVEEAGSMTLSSGAVMQRLQVYTPSATTTAPMTQTYSAPQVPVTTSVVESQSVASQPMASPITYAAPQAPLPSGTVVVHPPVTVTAEEFAKLSGTIVDDPLPVTPGFETTGAVNDAEADNAEAGKKKSKKLKKKKKSKQCC